MEGNLEDFKFEVLSNGKKKDFEANSTFEFDEKITNKLILHKELDADDHFVGQIIVLNIKVKYFTKRRKSEISENFFKYYFFTGNKYA